VSRLFFSFSFVSQTALCTFARTFLSPIPPWHSIPVSHGRLVQLPYPDPMFIPYSYPHIPICTGFFMLMLSLALILDLPRRPRPSFSRCLLIILNPQRSLSHFRYLGLDCLDFCRVFIACAMYYHPSIVNLFRLHIHTLDIFL